MASSAPDRDRGWRWRSAPVAAPAAQAKRQAIAKLPTIETFTLANGLEVAVLATDAAPVVAVQVWYRAGSKDEPRDRRGSAHMFEHMMFKGTHARPRRGARAVPQRHRRLRQRADRRGRDPLHQHAAVGLPRLRDPARGRADAQSPVPQGDDRHRARGREGGDPPAGELADRQGLPALPRDRVHEASVRVDRGRQPQGSRRDHARGSQEVLRRVLPAEQRAARRRRQGDARAR